MFVEPSVILLKNGDIFKDLLMEAILIFLLLTLTVLRGVASIEIAKTTPTIDNKTDSYVIVSEDTPVGSVIAQIFASDPDGEAVTISLWDSGSDTQTLVRVNQTSVGPPQATADIVLVSPLDRDFSPSSRNLYFQLEDQSSNVILTVIQMVITDVNDEAPAFVYLPYRLDINEDSIPGDVVYTAISALDPDTGLGEVVTYTMQPITQSTNDAAKFRSTFSINSTSGHVRQLSALDYETIQFYQFNVTAKDGLGLQSSEVLTIRVLDIQDTPPEFLATPYMVTIAENTPNDTHIFTVRALDGDRGIPNDVFFTIVSGTCLDALAINGITGEVTVVGLVDRDAGNIRENGGLCVIDIRVTEQINGELSLNLDAMATTNLEVFVSDENDNEPSFNQDEYHAYISDTAQLNYPLQLENNTEIVIMDRDQGSSGILELVLRNQDGDMSYDFQPIPSVIASLGRPIITLKSPGLLFLRDTIQLTIIATERDTAEKLSATATIHIRVLRVATTTEATTSLIMTTPARLDPYIPSLLGAIFPCLLLIWIVAATCYYCWRTHRTAKNKIGHLDNENGHTRPLPVNGRASIQGKNAVPVPSLASNGHQSMA